jgi:catalase (peroxidase I)
MPVDIAQLKEAKNELEKLIKANSCGPILIRLAWHDSGTYENVRLQGPFATCHAIPMESSNGACDTV